MVINDFNVVGVAVPPVKADAPLVIDANTVLPRPVAFELLEAVARGNPEIVQGFGGVDRDQFAQQRTPAVAAIPPHRFAGE